MIPTIEQQQTLVDLKMATKKINEEDGLVTFKYHRKVMYDRLWNEYGGLLMECRGHTYDITTGELVVASPRKSFNYGENDWWSGIPLNTYVEMHRKYNGYLACVSWHHGKLIVSTTGTTTSDYAVRAKEYFEEHMGDYFPNNQFTYFFECCFEWDQHIVKEEYGMKYLGSRFKGETNYFTPASSTFCYTTTLEHALEIAHNDKGEGFMVYLREGDPNRLSPCKLKTPYYVGKKKLMRMSKLTTFIQYHRHLKQILDQRWWPTINELLTMEVNGELNWQELTELERRVMIESINKF